MIKITKKVLITGATIICILAVVVFNYILNRDKDNIPLRSIKVNKICESFVDKNNDTVYFYSLSIIKTFNETILACSPNEKKIFLLDKYLVLKKTIDLDSLNYLISGTIRDIELWKERIYIADTSYEIKVFDIDGRYIDKIAYKQKDKYFPLIDKLYFLDDTLFVGTYSISTADGRKTVSLGWMLNTKGEVIHEYNVPHKEDKKGLSNFEDTFLCSNDSLLIFTFSVKKDVVVFNKNGRHLFNAKLKIDENNYAPPHKENQFVAFTPTSTGTLVIENNKIFHLTLEGAAKNKIINVYDMSLKLIGKNKVDTNRDIWHYTLKKIGKLYYIFIFPQSFILIAQDE